jgi:hypothetical protein
MSRHSVRVCGEAQVYPVKTRLVDTEITTKDMSYPEDGLHDNEF